MCNWATSLRALTCLALYGVSLSPSPFNMSHHLHESINLHHKTRYKQLCVYHQQVVYKSPNQTNQHNTRIIHKWWGGITVILINLGITFGVRLRELSTMTHARSWRRSDNRRQSFIALNDSLRYVALLVLSLRGTLSGIRTQRMFQRFLAAFLEPQRHSRLQRIDI
jgi:hypothetical protein